MSEAGNLKESKPKHSQKHEKGNIDDNSASYVRSRKRRAEEELVKEGSAKMAKFDAEIIEDMRIFKIESMWMSCSDVDFQDECESLINGLELKNQLVVKHFTIKDRLEFRALLFVPSKLFEASNRKNNIKLYMDRCLINDNCEDLLPNYLEFMKCIVDFQDSRGSLQQNEIFKIIRKNLVDQCLELFKDLSKDKENYKKFYNQFSENLKLGVHEDIKNREKLIELLRFHSSASGNEFCSFAEYFGRMKKGQEHIYYVIGHSKEKVSCSKFVDRAKKREIEVIFMTEPSDDYVIKNVKYYQGKQLQCVAEGGLEFAKLDQYSLQHDDKITVLVPYDTRLLHHGYRVDQQKTLRKSTEIFGPMLGGGDFIPENEIEMKCIDPMMKTIRFIQRYSSNIFEDHVRRDAEVFIVIKYYSHFYFFGVLAGTSLREVVQAFRETYKLIYRVEFDKILGLQTEHFRLGCDHEFVQDGLFKLCVDSDKPTQVPPEVEEHENESPNLPGISGYKAGGSFY